MQCSSTREKGRDPGCLQRTDVIDRTLGNSLGLNMGSASVQTNGVGRNIKVECADEHSTRESNTGSPSNASKKIPPPNGKKTKGRVKIKMEFIDNKLRRYTTFSKRKTGIMKKAYELSTLTGTQVMLLVASETGHVYTFATRKLQPMITSDAGKALIQTCLNSPDPPMGLTPSAPDQRMSATGFEETDLTYVVGDDCESKCDIHRDYYNESKFSDTCLEQQQSQTSYDLSGVENYNSLDSSVNLYPLRGLVSQEGSNHHNNKDSTISTTATMAVADDSSAETTSVATLSLLSPAVITTPTSVENTTSNNKSLPTISMQLPNSAGFATIVASGGSLSPAVQLGTFHSSSPGQVDSIQQTTSPGQLQTLYKLSQTPFLSIPGPSNSQLSSSSSDSPSSSSQNTVTVIPTSQQNVSVVSGNVVIPTSTMISNTNNTVAGTVMYHTTQGLVYASPSSGALPEGVIFNIGQEQGNTSQQFITIPVPVTLAAPQQVVQNQSTGLGHASTSDNRLLSAVSDLCSLKREKAKK